MNQRGFSLTELLTVIALIGILSAIGTFSFSQYQVKSRIASQTRLLYGDLMEYRTKALYEKKNWTFKIAATGYGIYSSANTAVEPVKTVTLRYGVTSDNAADVVFSTQGQMTVSGNADKSICISSVNDAAVDSVLISMTRIQIGKKTGADCAAANITTQ